jgi:hypothetical protein
MHLNEENYRNPTFGRVWGWHSHSQNGNLGVLHDFQNFRVWLQGSKHLTLRRYLYHWKAIETLMSKMGSMSHLDICSTSYGKKKGRESNWQFDSQPLKVGNRPNLGACKWDAACHWKAIDESYKFASDRIPIGGLSKELCPRKVAGVQTRIVLGLLLGSPVTKKNHLDVGAVERRIEYYMGEGGGFPRVRPVVSLVNPRSLVACPSTKGAPKSELTNLLVGLMQVWVSK